MTRLISIVVLMISSAPAVATVRTFYTPLSGSSESPPNASPGIGWAFVQFDDVTHMMSVSAGFSGLISTTIAAHIHCCVSPQAFPPNAIVATMTPTFTGFPLGVTSGAYSNSFDMTQISSYNASFVTAHGGTAAGAEAALLAGLIAREAYFNLHTSAFPGGEIRGFLDERIFVDGFESEDSSEWSGSFP